MSFDRNENDPVRWPRLVVACAGAIPAALGAAGLLGWWSTPGIDPESTALPPGAAAGLLLLGGGAVALGLRRRVWAAVCGGGALLVGSVSLLGAFGIDPLRSEPLAVEVAPAAQLVAPNTALSLVLAGIALTLLSRSRRTMLSSLLPGVLASTTVALAAVALAGHAMSLEGMYTWGDRAPMALQTSVGLLLVAGGLCVYASIDPLALQSRVPPWLPLPVAVGGLTATLCVWRALIGFRDLVVEWLRSMILQQDNFVDEYLPELALIAGLVIVLLLTLAIHLGQKVSSRTAERRRALQELRRAHDELERRVEKRTMEIASVNEELEEEIASRKGLEKALRERAEQLADADRKKDEFLAMLGHELRNPLATLSLGLETMDLTNPGDPTFAETRDVMNERLRHIVRLVDDLLDVSRIRSGRITLRRTTLDLRDTVSTAVRSLEPLAREHGHTLSVSLPPEAVWVEADAARLEQIVSNLVSNAIRYTERDGDVRVSAEREDGAAVLRVSDTGIGIPREVLPHIFDRTFDLSFDREGGGLGLGLTLVRRLVRLHGGTVEAFSDGPGRGSEFVVRLPVAAAATETETRAAVDAETRRSSSPRRVLIVDDRTELVMMLKRLLEAWGHEVLVASDGAAALEVASRALPEVALIDIGLPGMSGYDLAGRLRERASRRPLLVAVTGYGQPDHRRRTRQAGFDHHLVKPVDLNALKDILESSANG